MRLVIETAGHACSVALFDGDALIASAHERVQRGHAERLLPMIAALPQGGRADTILVDCGPGSFTGVRVGLAAARGLGLGWRVPVTGYSSLALLAAACFIERQQDSVTIAIPGGHGEFFVQRYRRSPFQPMDLLASVRPETIEAPDLVLSDTIELDARQSQILDSGSTSLPPLPLYGRGADARPIT